jgi:hypothetical protein
VAVNKNFVVKNGLEVNTQLILADANTNKVGIGSTAPRFELDVAGGIGATDMYVVGVSTVLETFNVGSGGNVLSVIAGSGGIGTSKVGIGTAIPAYVLDVRSPVSTGQTALYVQGDVRITGDLTVDDITFDQATINNLSVSQGTETQFLVVSGVSTYGGNLDINAAVDITGYTNIDDDVNITGTLNVGGATTVGGYLDVNASADISGTVNIGGATTIGGYLDVNDSIDATGTLSVGGATTIGGYLDVNDSSDISGTLNVGGATTIGGYLDINADTDINGTLNVSGVSTLGTVLVSSGIVTASSGIVTYYGDGSQLSGVIGGIGINTAGGLVGFGVTYLHLYGSGVSTTFYDANSGIATVFFQGGGGGATVSVSTVAPTSPTSGDLWYNNDLARTFIYYDEVALGIGATAVWIDAAPFNVGGNYLTKFGDSMLAGLGVTVGTASTPSVYFNGDIQTGFFSPTTGNFNVVSVGSTILNVNTSGIIVTGITTATDFDSLSDINYKENIVTVNNALLKVEQLRGVKFDWKESGSPSYGVIAQELEQVLPELVHGNDPKTVNYNGIIGVLIEAIKELKAEVEELKSNQN